MLINLCHGKLQEFGEVKRLEAILTEDEIVYHESVGDVSLSTSITDSSTNVLGLSTSNSSPFMS